MNIDATTMLAFYDELEKLGQITELEKEAFAKQLLAGARRIGSGIAELPTRASLGLAGMVNKVSPRAAGLMLNSDATSRLGKFGLGVAEGGGDPGITTALKLGVEHGPALARRASAAVRANLPKMQMGNRLLPATV